MKKTSTRLASVGGLVILGACAIALAQHDSRYRERAPIETFGFGTQSTDPIEVAANWTRTMQSVDDSSMRIVRANNGETDDSNESQTLAPPLPLSTRTAALPLPPADDEFNKGAPVVSARLSDQPLNQIAQGQKDLESLPDRGATTRLVSGEIPTDPPAWLNSDSPPALPSTLPNAQASAQPSTQPNNQLPATNSLPSTIPPSLPSQSGNALPAPPALGGSSGASPRSLSDDTSNNRYSMPGLPSGPSSRGDSGASSNDFPNDLRGGGTQQRSVSDASQSIPSRLPAGGTSQGGIVQSRASDMSDTQRGVMPATDLTGGPTVGNAGASAGFAQPSFATGTDPIPSLPSASAPRSQSGQSNFGSQYRAPVQDSSYPRTSSSAASGSDLARGSLARLVSNQPGNRFLDGSQNPVMQIQKRAPEEIQVGKKATFIIVVRNAGNAKAHGVTVLDSVPRGAKFVESIPTAKPGANGLLTWQLGEMGPGEERSIQLQIIPEVQGEVGSVATVLLAAQASVRTVATLPKIEVLLQTQPDVLIGDFQEMDVTVRNVGTGVARGVRLEADIPQELRHESGDSQLEANIGDLRPNETKRIKLRVQAMNPGKTVCAVRALAADNISDSKRVNVEVKAPSLVASITGPKLRYLERQATYKIQVKNNGTATASDLQFQVHLPAGLKFNAADVHGHYDPATHTVAWGLHELPAGQTAPIEVTVLPVELGPQMIAFKAEGELGATAEAKSQVVVDGLSELAFTIGQDDGTIEVGSVSTYSVQVTNVGNKADKNVQLAVELPAGASLVAVVNAPVEYRTQSNQIIFAPIREMRNKDQHIYRFQVKHSQPGKQIVRTKLISENWPNAVVKEEGTLVYNDRN